MRQAGSPRSNPDWLHDAYVMLGRSAEQLGHTAVALQAYGQAYGTKRFYK